MSSSKALKYKFVPPQAIDGAIRRVHLLERIFSSPVLRVVFVQAPAGHGKTTLLQQIMAACRQRGRTVGWLTLDEGDDDPTRFLSHLHALIDIALAQPAAADSAEAYGTRGRFGPIEELLGRIANPARPLAIFIDEFQVLTSEAILGIMARLLERLPDETTFYIGSRTLPSLGLGRMQIRNSAIILKTQDLRFTRGETARFMAVGDGTAVHGDLVEELFNRTEGWPAALQAHEKAELGIAYSDRGDAVFSGAYAMAFSGLAYLAQGRMRDALRQYRRGFAEASRARGS